MDAGVGKVSIGMSSVLLDIRFGLKFSILSIDDSRYHEKIQHFFGPRTDPPKTT